MFRGQSRHNIDSKGRVSLPARFRDALLRTNETGLILTPDPFEPCLHLYPLGAWEEFERKVSALPSMDRNIIQFRRLYISPAIDVEVDGAGRIRIPPDLRQKAQLEKEALWAGMGLKAELWSTPLWEAAIAMTDEQRADFRDTVQELIRV
jgi:MraZ protein